jgi:hypothetical protein
LLQALRFLTELGLTQSPLNPPILGDFESAF